MGDGNFRVDLENLKVEKKVGGSIKDTSSRDGHRPRQGGEPLGMPKRIEGARIALVSSALEIEKTEFDSKINITAPAQMQQFLDEETEHAEAHGGEDLERREPTS